MLRIPSAVEISQLLYPRGDELRWAKPRVDFAMYEHDCLQEAASKGG
jgi:hypothetical protein